MTRGVKGRLLGDKQTSITNAGTSGFSHKRKSAWGPESRIFDDLLAGRHDDEERSGHRDFRLQAAEVCSTATGRVIVIRAPSPALAASMVPPMSLTMP